MESTAAVPSSIAVKLFFKDEIHRFEIRPATLAILRAEIEKIFPSESYSVSYTDDEGDQVTLKTENEMSHALSLVKPPLRIRVTPVAAPFAPASPSLPTDAAKPLQVAKAQFREKVAEAKSSVQAAKQALKSAKDEFKQEVKKGLRQWGQYQREQLRNNPAQATANRQPVVRPLDSRFVQHVAGKDDAQYAPNVTFVKTFRFRNIGSSVWQPQIRLLLVSMANHLSSPPFVEIGKEVAPDEEVDIALTLRTPEKLGNYDAFYRLATTDGKKFGQRVRCRVQVTNSPVIESSSSPDSSDNLSSSSTEDDDDDSDSSSDSSSSESSSSEESDLKPAAAKEGTAPAPAPTTAATAVAATAAGPAQTEFQAQLEQLTSMGFADRELNIRLLNECFGDLHATVKKLLRKKFKAMMKDVKASKKSLKKVKKAKKATKKNAKKDFKAKHRSDKADAHAAKHAKKQAAKEAKKKAPTPSGAQPSGETVVLAPILPVGSPAPVPVAAQVPAAVAVPGTLVAAVQDATPTPL